VLREVFNDKHILAAFNPKEMLNYGLAAAKVSPKAWNQFLRWFKESGEDEGEASQLPEANPYIQQFGEYEKQLSTLGKSLEELRQERAQSIADAETSKKQAAFDSEMQRIDGMVKESMAKYDDVPRELLLSEMAKDENASLTVEDIAKKIHVRLEARYNDYVKNKQKTISKAPKSPIKGQSVNIVRRQPKTFEEAGQMVAERYGDGRLKARG
jgi:hypothetical protein